MAKKKKVPQIVKDIRDFRQHEIDFSFQKNISYSQFSMYTECPKKWSLQYREGHKVFTSTIHTVFGTALHEALQYYLDVMYEKSAVAADKLELEDFFEEKLKEEYKKQYKLNKSKHFSTSEQLNEFYGDGVDIIEDFKKNRAKHFSKKGWWLVGCEIPISITPKSEYPNLIYQGYLDVVLYHEPTNTFKIIDIKTSGWRQKEKSDEIKQFQLILYKKFFAEQFNVDVKNIEIEFFIVKRKMYEHKDFVIRRIQKFVPPSGKTKQKRVTLALDKFINEAFDNGSHKDVDHQPTINDKCKWCVYNKTHLCPATS
jgi:hypothetical protein